MAKNGFQEAPSKKPHRTACAPPAAAWWKQGPEGHRGLLTPSPFSSRFSNRQRLRFKKKKKGRVDSAWSYTPVHGLLLRL